MACGSTTGSVAGSATIERLGTLRSASSTPSTALAFDARKSVWKSKTVPSNTIFIFAPIWALFRPVN
jgi:hypothetical protein